MARKRVGATDSNGQAVEAELMDASGALVQQPTAAPIVVNRNRRTPVGNIGDGGYFDASSGKRKPLFTLSPATDRWGAWLAIRAYLSSLRHHPLATMALTAGVAWVSLGGLSFSLNYLRANTQRCDGSMWNPTIFGCNMVLLIKPAVSGTAGRLHDMQMGKGPQAGPVRSQTVIKTEPVRR